MFNPFELQHMLDIIIVYHDDGNDVSRWIETRALVNKIEEELNEQSKVSPTT